MHFTCRYQVTNYGLGGTCEQHLDAQGFFDGTSPNGAKMEQKGDYIATVMAWLADTTAGGGTSFFTTAGVTVYPQKGSAAFWWDITHDGRRDSGGRFGLESIVGLVFIMWY